MSEHERDVDDHDAEGEEEAEEQQQPTGERSFRDTAEHEEVTIGDIVELDEDEEDDDDFDPNEDDDDADGADGSEDDEEDEDEDADVVEEEELAALAEADVDGEVERHIERTAAADEEHEEAAADGEEDEEEEEEDEDDGEGGEDGDAEVGAFESGMGMMNQNALGAFVSNIMTADGPTVTAVLLKADGTKQELTLDMTPRLDSAGRVLGAKTSFVGQYPSLQVVILQRRDQDNAQLPKNQHTLPTPFDTEEVRGDMLLVRMDKDSEPQNLTAAEWTAFERSGGSEVTGNGAANGDGADAAQPKHKKQRRR